MTKEPIKRRARFVITKNEINLVLYVDSKVSDWPASTKIEIGENGLLSENTRDLIFLKLRSSSNDSFGDELPAYSTLPLLKFIAQICPIEEETQQVVSIDVDVTFLYSSADPIIKRGA